MGKAPSREGKVRIQAWLTPEERAYAKLTAELSGKSLEEWVSDLVKEKIMSPGEQKG